jgi:serine/threonine-protein kinase
MNEQPKSREGTQFGPYRLLRLIGKGGMGEVYEAEDTVKDRIVALKLLPESVSHDPVFRKRLQREAHSAGRLQEPHVVPIHDYGEIDGVLYVDMRMINGSDLRKILKNFGPMTPARAVAIVRQIASALDAAHEGGVMHRDVKPENVLINRDDFAYLVDFGIANAATDEKLTELGTAVGTYAYMAPERFSGDAVTYRADVYALACVLHECLTGAQPFVGNSIGTVITAHLMQPVPRPSVQRPGIPAAFDQVIAKGMAKKPDDRFASAGDLAMAATDALTIRDQDQAETILQRGAAATMPGMAMGPAATMAAQPPPPQQYGFTGPPAGGSAWPPPAPPPPPLGPTPPGQKPKGNKGPLIAIGAVVGVVVLVLGAIGIFFLVKDDDKKASPTMTTASPTKSPERSAPTRTRTTAPTPTENPDSFQAKLMALIPTGYPTSVCQAASPPSPGALATIDCDKSVQPGGPEAARYSIFADKDQLILHFNESLKENEETLRCPGADADSPIDWNFKANPDEVAGQVACGSYQGNADVMWTQYDQLLLADVQSTDMNALHDWWLNYS